MKQKFFTLLAAVLLGSISAFAQNTNPVKGDVNEDGTVDVADITAVIKIMRDGGGTAEQPKNYWYVGLTQPTVENYKTIATEVTSYNDFYEYTNTSSQKSKIYVLVANDVSLAFIDNTFTGEVSKEEIITINIPGHKVYRTAVGTASGGKTHIAVGDKWKHYYLGMTEPTADNIESLTPSYKSFAEMNNKSFHVTAGGKLYLLAPIAYSEPVSLNALKNNAFLDSAGNHVEFSTWTGYHIGTHQYIALTVDKETTIKFKYPYE